MKFTRVAAAAGVFLNAIAISSWAADAPANQQAATATTVIAGQSIPVPAGGLYDRYHSNPPLSVIAAEAPDVDLSWFRELKKTRVDMGFESYSPNFYYKNSKVTAVFTADLDKLKSLMPAQVLEQVQPLQVWPGRGVVGYNLPKWLTGIDFKENDQSVVFEIIDSQTGKVDVTLETDKLSELSSEADLVTNGFTNIGHNGELTYGYAVSRQLSHASSTSEDSVKLVLGDGSLSTYIKALGLGEMLKYEYVPNFQSALYAPAPLQSLLDRE